MEFTRARITLVQAAAESSSSLKALGLWRQEELVAELEARGLDHRGGLTTLMLRVQAASIREW